MASVSMRVCPRQVGSVPPDSQLRIHTTFTCIQCTAVFFVEKMQKYKIQHTPKIHKYKIHKLRKDRYSAQNSHRLHLPPLHWSCMCSFIALRCTSLHTHFIKNIVQSLHCSVQCARCISKLWALFSAHVTYVTLRHAPLSRDVTARSERHHHSYLSHHHHAITPLHTIPPHVLHAICSMALWSGIRLVSSSHPKLYCRWSTLRSVDSTIPVLKAKLWVN